MFLLLLLLLFVARRLIVVVATAVVAASGAFFVVRRVKLVVGVAFLMLFSVSLLLFCIHFAHTHQQRHSYKHRHTQHTDAHTHGTQTHLHTHTGTHFGCLLAFFLLPPHNEYFHSVRARFVGAFPRLFHQRAAASVVANVFAPISNISLAKCSLFVRIISH